VFDYYNYCYYVFDDLDVGDDVYDVLFDEFCKIEVEYFELVVLELLM